MKLSEVKVGQFFQYKNEKYSTDVFLRVPNKVDLSSGFEVFRVINISDNGRMEEVGIHSTTKYEVFLLSPTYEKVKEKETLTDKEKDQIYDLGVSLYNARCKGNWEKDPFSPFIEKLWQMCADLVKKHFPEEKQDNERKQNTKSA